MLKYKNILVAYDGSELSKKALKVAATLLGDVPEAQISIVNVWQYPNLPYDGGIHHVNQISEDLQKHAQSLVDEAANQLSGQSVHVNKVVLNGYPPSKILEYAEEQKIDLIVMGNRGLNSLQRLFLGSVSHRVVQEAPCDVLVVK
jgi:nucleotide-binding universal stress UspA family protein